MLRIVICDDETLVIQQVKEILKSYSLSEGVKMSIRSFNTAEKLYEYLRVNACDLIFLDIELGGMNGVELGRRIREERHDYNTKIVYISAKDCYDRQLLDLSPLGFVSKPFNKDRIITMVLRARRMMEQLEDQEMFTYLKNKEVFRVDINDIIYFESLNHNVRIVTVKGDDEFYDTMGNVKKKLPPDRFIQTHRSVYVNYTQIKQATYESLLMNNNETLYISKRKRPDVRDFMNKIARDDF